MIADGHRVIVQRIHREHHGIRRLIVFLIVVVLERSSLNRIARIEEQDVLVFLTKLPDERGNFCQTAVVGFVGVVIHRKQVTVEIGCAENDQVNAFWCTAAGAWETCRNQRQHNCQRHNESFSIQLHNSILHSTKDLVSVLLIRAT